MAKSRISKISGNRRSSEEVERLISEGILILLKKEIPFHRIQAVDIARETGIAKRLVQRRLKGNAYLDDITTGIAQDFQSHASKGSSPSFLASVFVSEDFPVPEVRLLCEPSR